MTVQFVDQPPDEEPGVWMVWRRVNDELQANPGRWAIVADDVQRADRAYDIARYLRRWYHLEAAVRVQPDASWTVFARAA